MAYTENPSTQGNRSRRARQRGNAMLGGALALPPLLMLLFATIDFSIAILVKNTVQSAVREGVRYAMTGQTVGALGQDESIRTVVENNSLGFLNSSNGESLISITFYNPGTLAQELGVGSNARENIVQDHGTGLSWLWMVPCARSSTPY